MNGKVALAYAVVSLCTVVGFSQDSHAGKAGKTGKQNAVRQAAKRPPVADQISGQGYGLAGCGLGSIIFGEKPGMVQIVAATTNGIYSHQSFAISSGTSNCNDHYGAGPKTASLFITANREALEKEISRGNGETVAHLSKIMGCNDSSVLGAKLQQKFETIFPNENATSDQITQSIMNTVQSDESLAQSCNPVV